MQLDMNLMRASQIYSQTMQQMAEALTTFSFNEEVSETGTPPPSHRAILPIFRIIKLIYFMIDVFESIDPTIEMLGATYKRFGDIYESTARARSPSLLSSSLPRPLPLPVSLK